MPITLDGTNGITQTTGVVTTPTGSVSAPAITVDGDSNTGIFFPAADTIAFAEGGVEAARINSNGALVLRGGSTTASGVGVSFPATQSASSDANTLDDYEEGSFTPTGNGITFSSATGRYTKIGRVVQWSASFTFPSTTNGSNAGAGSLPFTCEDSPASRAGTAIGYSDYGSGITAMVAPNQTNCFFYNLSGNGLTNANMSGKTVYLGGTYLV